jgi:nucleoporin POM152
MPTVKISKGKTSVVDIHEGGDVEILFEFTGTPPFEFT